MCVADLKWGEAETMAMKKTCPASRVGEERDSIYFPRLLRPPKMVHGGKVAAVEKETSSRKARQRTHPSLQKQSSRLGKCFFIFFMVAVAPTASQMLQGHVKLVLAFQGAHSQSVASV